ncbi:MAG: hypothetical protein ACE5JP_05280 [Candidatus Bipolaricaulia bacterium]
MSGKKSPISKTSNLDFVAPGRFLKEKSGSRRGLKIYIPHHPLALLYLFLEETVC